MISVVLDDWLIDDCLVLVCVCENPARRKTNSVNFYFHRKEEANLFWSCFRRKRCNCWYLIWWVLSLCGRIENRVSRNRKIATKTFWWNKIDKWTHPNVINGDRDCFSSSDNVICFAQLAFFAQYIYVRKKSFRWIHQATNCVCSECLTTTSTPEKETNNQFRSIGFDMNSATVAVAARLLANKCVVECGRVEVALASSALHME